MDKWWMNPVLQGDDNEYGEYDYLIEAVPDSESYWYKSKCHCDSCGKDRHINKIYHQYFRTMDGYDSMDYTECWLCYINGRLNEPVSKFKRRVCRFFRYYFKIRFCVMYMNALQHLIKLQLKMHGDVRTSTAKKYRSHFIRVLDFNNHGINFVLDNVKGYSEILSIVNHKLEEVK